MKKQPIKFINAKKGEQKTSQFHKSPSIPRSFTEENERGSQKAARKIPEFHKPFSWVNLATLRVHGEVVFVSFICGIFLMAIAVMGLQLQESLKELGKRESLHQALEEHQQYWKEIVAKYPDYKDAYFQLAVVSYQLGETMEARQALGKVLEIDPNDVTGQEFAKKIRG